MRHPHKYDQSLWVTYIFTVSSGAILLILSDSNTVIVLSRLLYGGYWLVDVWRRRVG